MFFEELIRELFFFDLLGYGDRRRYNDNENTVYDAQETDGNSINQKDKTYSFLFAENQQYNHQYPSQRNRYGGYRNNRGGGGNGNNYRYNNNNSNKTSEYYEDSYIDAGQSQPMPTKKSQQTLTNNGTNSNDAPETINGNGAKGQRTPKQQSNGVK